MSRRHSIPAWYEILFFVAGAISGIILTLQFDVTSVIDRSQAGFWIVFGRIYFLILVIMSIILGTADFLGAQIPSALTTITAILYGLDIGSGAVFGAEIWISLGFPPST